MSRTEQARVLVLRQLVLTVATLMLVAGALALLHWHGGDTAGTHYARVVTQGRPHVHVVHDEPGRLLVRVAVAQLALCAVLALVAVAHAARVIAFVFPRPPIGEAR